MAATITDDIVATVLESIEEKSYEDEKEKAGMIKDEANQFFKDQVYDVAADLYSVAIEIHPTAVLYGNRAQAYLKKELYGSALEDADNAIAIDPSYVKGFYRRATANMALGRFKKALTDYQAVVKEDAMTTYYRMKSRKLELEIKKLERELGEEQDEAQEHEE